MLTNKMHRMATAKERSRSCIDSGVSNIDQDHSGPLMPNVETDYQKHLGGVVFDPMEVVVFQVIMTEKMTFKIIDQ